MIVIKRDGTNETFNPNKIKRILDKAFAECGNRYKDYNYSTVTNGIISQCKEKEKITSVEIENIVENELMRHNFLDVAKAFIEYKYKKEKEQNADIKYKTFMEKMADKLFAKHAQNQNANVDEKSFGGRNGEALSELDRTYALENLVSENARYNHENNMVYIHDLDAYVLGNHNCLSVPIDKLLANGFLTRNTDIRPAHSISTAFQLVAVIFQLQSLQQFGGVSATHLDWSMVPYVRWSFFKHYRDGLTFIDNKPFDDKLNHEMSIEDEEYKKYSDKAYQYALEMTERETYQAVEGMYHNLK